MSLRLTMAKAVGNTLTWGLQKVAHRPGGTIPGKVGLRIDPQLIADLRGKVGAGSVVVVGTNGKTSVTNLIADAFEADGRSVICNRTGANMGPGVASALLQARPAQWGVFESDELWLARILPQLRADYVLLLNLFRDQLDRCGEISRIQESIAGALASSPDTTLVYNADDPLCEAIARKVPNRVVPFGVAEDMGLAQNTVADAQMCQECSGMVEYGYRQYGQLGDYRCPACGFARPALEFAATDVRLDARGASFEVAGRATGRVDRVSTGQPTPYLVYNLLAADAIMQLTGVDGVVFQRAVDAFDPRNGRLQRYVIDGYPVLLNLAKNPTGFNQNLKIIERDAGPKAIAFFVNDYEGDGRDISWIWDIDFEELAGHGPLVVFSGGTRSYDLRVRLKYAGIDARLIEGVEDVFAALPGLVAEGALPADAGVYAIANYTALPPVHAALDRLAATRGGEGAASGESAPAPDAGGAVASAAPGAASAAGGEDAEGAGADAGGPTPAGVPTPAPTPDQPPVVIAHLFPDQLNLYGDGGNVRVLEQRLAWRGIPVEIRHVHYGDAADLAAADLVFLGGGPDREQKLASEKLAEMREDLAAYVADDGPLLAICGGYQILGRQWLWGDELVPGLGIIDAETRRPGTSADRLTDNLALRSPLASHPVVGYENHAGRTYLGPGVEPLGAVASKTGHGNNEDDRADGVRFRNVVGTYSHGPLLSKNPEVADWLLARALERRARRAGVEPAPLVQLDDAVELAANAWMAEKLGVAS